MHITKVDQHNLKDLYSLNKELAFEEDQVNLFTAQISHYQTAFIGESPAVQAYLCNLNNVSIGFYACLYKFATYLGERVLHIEDIYIQSEHREKYIDELIDHALHKASSEKCCRVEMRVLKSYNIGYGHIEKAGFSVVEKWNIFRFEGRF